MGFWKAIRLGYTGINVLSAILFICSTFGLGALVTAVGQATLDLPPLAVIGVFMLSTAVGGVIFIQKALPALATAIAESSDRIADATPLQSPAEQTLEGFISDGMRVDTIIQRFPNSSVPLINVAHSMVDNWRVAVIGHLGLVHGMRGVDLFLSNESLGTYQEEDEDWNQHGTVESKRAELDRRVTRLRQISEGWKLSDKQIDKAQIADFASTVEQLAERLRGADTKLAGMTDGTDEHTNAVRDANAYRAAYAAWATRAQKYAAERRHQWEWVTPTLDSDLGVAAKQASSQAESLRRFGTSL